MTTTADTTTPTERLRAALADPDATFTRDQVAWLMAEAARWARETVDADPDPLSFRAGRAAGYYDRVREENSTYPPPPLRICGTWVERPPRRTVDRLARQRRKGDHRGGPARYWPPSWCGLADADGMPKPHRPHTETAPKEFGGDRYRCSGRP